LINSKASKMTEPVLCFAGRIVPKPSMTAVNMRMRPAINKTGCGLYFLTIRKPTQKVIINEITILKLASSSFFF
jgi:hypothetical protein